MEVGYDIIEKDSDDGINNTF